MSTSLSNLNRIGISLGASVALTLLIFLGMQALITKTGSVVDDSGMHALVSFIHGEADDELQTKDRKVKKPPTPPKEPPKPEMQMQQNLTQNNESLSGINLGNVDIDMNLNGGLGGINTGDGEYLPIIKVAPVYPRSAAQRGIEGFVVLEFTVNELGMVVDPKVINAEPPGIFNRAAMDAARKFKYKPRTQEGKGISVSGVKNIIRFELEKSQ